MRCPACSTNEVPQNARFCPQCGASQLVITSQHLFGDFVMTPDQVYTSLTGLRTTEEEFAAILAEQKQASSQLRRHNGTIYFGVVRISPDQGRLVLGCIRYNVDDWQMLRWVEAENRWVRSTVVDPPISIVVTPTLG
jgi:hypothetical protein